MKSTLARVESRWAAVKVSVRLSMTLTWPGAARSMVRRSASVRITAAAGSPESSEWDRLMWYSTTGGVAITGDGDAASARRAGRTASVKVLKSMTRILGTAEASPWVSGLRLAESWGGAGGGEGGAPAAGRLEGGAGA